ncbi:hypothetical protein J2S43_000298 [Catenuloplanes nepalensis]|uniref:Uncharacterized protein n=1 Tax=Catenuloplanes nepalensis TaxID=587533 RepID=A0ABT9MK44_9ACTN|nr:hypothetical protein [Catenuloplanes nepalensis]MDP9791786.1 hypothetical protein [Catenuloplanes nepalensis]
MALVPAALAADVAGPAPKPVAAVLPDFVARTPAAFAAAAARPAPVPAPAVFPAFAAPAPALLTAGVVALPTPVALTAFAALAPAVLAADDAAPAPALLTAGVVALPAPVALTAFAARLPAAFAVAAARPAPVPAPADLTAFVPLAPAVPAADRFPPSPTASVTGVPAASVAAADRRTPIPAPAGLLAFAALMPAAPAAGAAVLTPVALAAFAGLPPAESAAAAVRPTPAPVAAVLTAFAPFTPAVPAAGAVRPAPAPFVLVPAISAATAARPTPIPAPADLTAFVAVAPAETFLVAFAALVLVASVAVSALRPVLAPVTSTAAVPAFLVALAALARGASVAERPAFVTVATRPPAVRRAFAVSTSPAVKAAALAPGDLAPDRDFAMAESTSSAPNAAAEVLVREGRAVDPVADREVTVSRSSATSAAFRAADLIFVAADRAFAAAVAAVFAARSAACRAVAVASIPASTASTSPADPMRPPALLPFLRIFRPGAVAPCDIPTPAGPRGSTAPRAPEAPEPAESSDAARPRDFVLGVAGTRSARPIAGAVGRPTSIGSGSGIMAASVIDGIWAMPVAGAVRSSAALAAPDSPGSIGTIGIPACSGASPDGGIEAAAAPGPIEIAPFGALPAVPSERFDDFAGRDPAALDALAGRAAAAPSADGEPVEGSASRARADREDVVAEALVGFLAAAMVGPPWDFCACAIAPDTSYRRGLSLRHVPDAAGGPNAPPSSVRPRPPTPRCAPGPSPGRARRRPRRRRGRFGVWQGTDPVRFRPGCAVCTRRSGRHCRS